MKYLSFKPIDAEAADQSSITTSAIDLSQIFKLSAQIVVGAGTIAGSVQLQVSNDIIDTFYMMSQAPTNWSNLGSPTALTTSGVSLIPQQDICYRALRMVYSNTGFLVNNIATVADVSSNLNNKYFLLDTHATDYYVWFNVGGAGVDPAIAGRTGVEVDIAANDSANTIATAARAAMTIAITEVVVSGATNHIITTDSVAGSAPPAVDGAAATHFTFTNNAPTAEVSVQLMALAF